MTGLEILLIVGIPALLAALWPKVCAWFADHCNPWLKRHVPTLQPYLEQAFQVLDKVATTVRALVLRAWQKVREALLKGLIEFLRRADGSWFRRLTTYAQAASETKVTRRIEEQEMDWSELPEDVRAEALSRGHVAQRDFTRDRDQELAMAVGSSAR